MIRASLLLAVLALLAGAACAADDDDGAQGAANAPALDADQQKAAGIVVARLPNAQLARRDQAIGVVLDPLALTTDAGDVEAAAAALRPAAAELERTRGLYSAGAGASLKSLQAVQAESARARAQADAADAKFTLRWYGIAALLPAQRQKLLGDVAAGRALIVRADLPGRHVLGTLPERALLDVDGLQVPGRVLGPVGAAGSEETQGAGVLIAVANPPSGLAAGARLPVALLGANASGVLVPREAVLYDENGALVYKRLTAKPGDKAARYAPVRIRLLQPQGERWLVDGIDDDDDIVVHGAGVLWSLQGIVGHAAGDIDDDD